MTAGDFRTLVAELGLGFEFLIELLNGQLLIKQSP